jgi:hypothetical protein
MVTTISGIERIALGRPFVDAHDARASIRARTAVTFTELHNRAELLRKRGRNAIHAADQLKNGGLLGDVFLEQHVVRHVGVEARLNGAPHRAARRLPARPRQDLVARAGGLRPVVSRL